MSRISCSVKPLDIRSITVGDPCPALYSSIAAATSSADLAWIAGIPPLRPWQPEQEDAPGGSLVKRERGRLLRQGRPA